MKRERPCCLARAERSLDVPSRSLSPSGDATLAVYRSTSAHTPHPLAHTSLSTQFICSSILFHVTLLRSSSYAACRRPTTLFIPLPPYVAALFSRAPQELTGVSSC